MQQMRTASGADLDELLTMKAMINQNCRTGMSNLQKLSLIRKSLTKEATKVLTMSLTMAHIDYANVRYAELPE